MKYFIPIFTGIGDAIMLTPLISSIQQNDINAKIHIVGDDKYASLTILKNKTDITFSMINNGSDLITFLQNNHFDFHLCSINTTHLWVIKILIKANCTNIYTHFYAENLNSISIKNILKFFYHKYWKVNWIPMIPSRHDIESNVDLLEFALKKPINRILETWISIEDAKDTFKKFHINENDEYICIQPSAANGQATPKRWAPENFVDLCNKLNLNNPKLKIYLVGDQGDSKNVVEKYLWPTNTINLCGKTTLAECVAILKKSKKLICHDSGLMHISSALNHPTIALLGPTDYKRTGPTGKNIIKLESKNKMNRIMYYKNKSENSYGLNDPFFALSEIKVSEIIKYLT